MDYIPMWWLVLSGVFFALNCIVFIGVAFLIVTLVKVVREIQPKVASIADRVERIAEKVDDLAKGAKGAVDVVSGAARGIAQKVEGIASTAKGTVDRVTGKAEHVASRFESVSTGVADRAEQASPVLAIAMMTLNLVQTILDMRRQSAQKNGARSAAGPPQ